MKTIQLTKGKTALVDDDDYEKLINFKWHSIFCKEGNIYYAGTRIRLGVNRWTTVLMHRMILCAKSVEQVDHENHNGLDNRRSNMRITNNRGNGMNVKLGKLNTSGHCGVSRHSRDKKWRAQVKINGKYVHLGNYTDKADAIAARQAANIKYGFHENHGKPLGEIP